MSSHSTRYVPMLTYGLPDSVIESIYCRLKEEGALRWLFFSGTCTCYAEFLQLVRDTNTLFYVVIDTEEDRLASIFWLNFRTDINCSIHTAFFKEYFGRSVSVSKEVLGWLFKNLTGVESLLCFIPVPNRLANKFAERVGWIKAGTVPNLMRDIKTSQLVSGDMYYITKGEV